jgi:hypothetical protein
VLTALTSPTGEDRQIKLGFPAKATFARSAKAGDPHRLDNIAAAIVIGLTAMFVATIFGVVTNFIPSLLVTVILGSVMGISSGAIAYILMRD